MKRAITLTLFTLAALLVGAKWLNQFSENADAAPELSVASVMGSADTAGFARAFAPRAFVFPADHGPHPDFRTEWWYYTGNLQTESGRHFGYQFTLFRSALSADTTVRESEMAANQLYMGHFALSDIQNDNYYYFERFSRAANGLAGAQAAPFRVWLEDWQTTDPDADSTAAFPKMRIDAAAEGVSLNIELTPEKPHVLQGDRGLSQKSAKPGNASYYYSLTRMTAEGSVSVNGETLAVNGLSWMDREWSTSALGDNQVGWDWFSLQLSDSSELMYYQLRLTSGEADPYSKGLLVAPDGASQLIKRDDVSLTVREYWDSPRGGRYPAGWWLQVPEQQIDLQISPLIANQELNVAIRYWEGAVKIDGTAYGKPVSGYGYVELTGYAEKKEKG